MTDRERVELDFRTLQERFLTLEKRVQEQGFQIKYLLEREAALTRHNEELLLRVEQAETAEHYTVWEPKGQPEFRIVHRLTPREQVV